MRIFHIQVLFQVTASFSLHRTTDENSLTILAVLICMVGAHIKKYQKAIRVKTSKQKKIYIRTNETKYSRVD